MKRVMFISVALTTAFIAAFLNTSISQALPVSPTYFALGDSVAAGAGLPVIAGATNEDTICGRSTQAYPYKVAAGLGTSVTHLACSGAKVDEGIYGYQTRGGSNVAPQLDRAFQAGTPDLITMTIGANDARWSQFIRSCYVWTCDTNSQSVLAKVYRADLRIELAYMLSKVQRLSGGNPPEVLLSGYFAPFSNLDCVETDRITSSEQIWLKKQANALNQAIQSVVPYYPFAQYVPIDFTGHELCSADSWVQGPNDLAPFHPTAEGQAAIADAFLLAL